MDKKEEKTVLNAFSEIKGFAAQLITAIVDAHGSPENDQPVLRCKKDYAVKTFDGELKLDKIIKQDDGSITVAVTDGKGSSIGFGIDSLPVESALILCHDILHEFGFGEIFNSLFTEAMNM